MVISSSVWLATLPEEKMLYLSCYVILVTLQVLDVLSLPAVHPQDSHLLKFNAERLHGVI